MFTKVKRLYVSVKRSNYFLPPKIPPFHKITPTDSTTSRLTKVAIITLIVVFKEPIAHKSISTESTNNKLTKTPKISRNLFFLFFCSTFEFLSIFNLLSTLRVSQTTDSLKPTLKNSSTISIQPYQDFSINIVKFQNSIITK